MLITHGIATHRILDADDLALLCHAFDAACLMNGDPSANAETIAKAIIVTYEQGVTDEKELVEGAIFSASALRIVM